MRRHRALEADRERGSAVTEFVMVSGLLVFLLFAVLQLAGILYVRSVAGSAAADGARYAANAGVDPAAGGSRARDSLDHAVAGGRLTRAVQCSGDLDVDPVTGVRAARVVCRGRIRSILLPLGAFTDVDVVSESLKEGP